MRNQLLVYLLFLVASVAAYSDYSFSSIVKINDDGSAHVTEKTIFLFENAEERKAFEFNLNLGESTLIEWKKFSDNIKYHIKGTANNTKITAKREFSVSFDAGSVIVDYDTDKIFLATQIGSRRTVYSLNSDMLAFDRTKSGQISLGNNVALKFELPKDAEFLRAAPDYDMKGSEISWAGPISGKWEIEFAREMPLSDEVSNFFIDTYDLALDKLPLLLLAAFSLLVLFVLVKFGRK